MQRDVTPVGHVLMKDPLILTTNNTAVRQCNAAMQCPYGTTPPDYALAKKHCLHSFYRLLAIFPIQV